MHPREEGIVIVPVYNEEKNIERCLESVVKWVEDIVIVDSYSTDKTLKLASKYTTHSYQHKAESFSEKMNWALASLPINTPWIMRLDADEIIVEPEAFFSVLQANLDAKGSTSGYYINRRYFFINHWIRHGGMYPRKVLRLWRENCAQFENRLVDEKMIVKGNCDFLDIDIADINQKGFSDWFMKHLRYAKNEAHEAGLLADSKCTYDYEFDRITYQNKQKYYSAPLFLRPFIYFAYRLIVLMGFKDGLIGVFYHFMHAFVYRELVDFFIAKQWITRCVGKRNL